jgi:Bacterial pre-peptidase C-terminal domain/Metallo-peptidase family M12B Reprolysin-like
MPSDRGSHSYRRQLRLEILEPRCCLALAVPAFSSLPGANHTIYLDFDGHVTQNTAWNKHWNNPRINSPAYDLDGNAAGYSSQELANLQSAWKRVAEDYIPFQVNVTTVDPGVEALRRAGSGDSKWGIRVVITADTEGTGAGGIGYAGSFTWNTDTPVFVYTRGEKSIAEAASHEVGHSLGLAHDGTTGSEYYRGHGSGETSWAPLMGVGYYSNVTTWSRGQYTIANNNTSSANYGQGSDDLAIITSRNGFGYRGDDFGNSLGTAGLLSGPTVSAAGIISTTTDVDVFRFQAGAGTAAFTVRPFATGSNLDVKAELLNSQGVTIAVADPATSLTAALSFRIASAGSYYLRVSGVGAGNPLATSPTGYTEYGSLGRYFITGGYVAGSTVSAPAAALSTGQYAPTKALSTAASTGSLPVGMVSPNGDGVGIPPGPIADAWSHFEVPESDFPFADPSGGTSAAIHAAAILQLIVTREAALIGLEPSDADSRMPPSGGGTLRGLPLRSAENLGALRKEPVITSSQRDQVFANEEDADWLMNSCHNGWPTSRGLTRLAAATAWGNRSR